MIRGIWIIAKKELACFFYTPVAYMLLLVALLFSGVAFYNFLAQLQGDITHLSYYFFATGNWPFLIIAGLMTPAITMRLIAEEIRMGTIEGLMTAPVSDGAVVLGKYLAAFLFYLLLWIPSLIYFAIILMLGGSFDGGMFAAGWIKIALAGAVFLSFGMFASAISANQIIAGLVGMVANLLFAFGAYLLWDAAPWDWLRRLLQHFDFVSMLNGSFERGILDSSHLVYLLSCIILFLFLTVRMVETRKWR